MFLISFVIKFFVKIFDFEHKGGPWYSKTPIYRASQGKGFRPSISGGPVNRIVKCTKLHINPVFGGKGKALVNRGTRYIGAR